MLAWFGFSPLVCSCCCLLVLRLGGATSPHLQLIQGQSMSPVIGFKRAAHSAAPCQSAANLHVVRLAPCFLVVTLLSSPGLLLLFFLFLFFPDLVCPLHPASVPQPLQPTQTQNYVWHIQSLARFCVSVSALWVQSRAELNALQLPIDNFKKLLLMNLLIKLSITFH